MSIEWVLLSALVVGLIGSGHCLGMCGGIAAAFSPSVSSLNPQRRIAATIVFNLGRISSYAIAGFVAGALSFVIGSQINIGYWSEIMRLATGITIAAIGIALLFQLPLLNSLEHLGQPVWRRLAPLTVKLRSEVTPNKAYLLGLLWGWIPCGMVYSMLLVALMSGQPHYGVMIMVCFGLGTLPALTLSGLFLAQLGRRFERKNLLRYAGLLCLLVGIWTALAPHMPLPKHQQHPLSTHTEHCTAK